MILVGQFDSPVTRRIGVVLNLYALPFSRNTQSVFRDAADIAKISPLTRIPALILDTGEVLIESAAICDYLDELVGPARALVPQNGPERRRILQDTALIQGTMEKIGVVVYERHYHPPAHRSAEWEGRCLAQISAGLAECERRCANPWFSGQTLSHADVMLTCTMGYIALRLPEVSLPHQHPNLVTLATRCESLPAFRAAAIGANETMPAVPK